MFGKRRSCSDNEPDVADKACFVAGKAAPSAGKANAAVAEAAGDAHRAKSIRSQLLSWGTSRSWQRSWRYRRL